MSWQPDDLVSDVDLVSYEAGILSSFGQTDWQARRTKALEDWLFPHLKARGLDPYKIRTRFESDALLSFTGAAYADRVGPSRDTATDDIDLAAIFATPSTDALYIGSKQPFRGVFLRLLDNVSSVAGALSVTYWAGTWEPLTLTDRTKLGTKTLAAGGSVTWTLPVDWASRKINNSAQVYWVRLKVSATPTGAKASQIGVIRASSLRAPATFRTLELIFREAPTGADGPWIDKAAFYRDEAESALQRAFLIVGGEFDTDATDLISEEEAAQTAEEVGGGPFRLERS